MTKQLAIGGEIFHQTATVAFGATDSAYAEPTTGFNIGAIYDFDEHNHLLVSPAPACRTRRDQYVLLVLGYQITGP